MEISFNGKKAVLTGAGRGIGKCIAMTLAQSGADIVIGDIIEAESLQTCEEIRALGRKAEFLRMDVRSYEQVEALVNVWDPVDIIIHCAGIPLPAHFLDAGQDEIKRLFDINVMGSSNITQAALKKMIPQRQGKILLLASVAGRFSDKTVTHYRMSKAAVISLALSAACIGADYNINVNAICPGIVRTPMWEALLDAKTVQMNMDREQVWETMIGKLIPMKRPQTEQDIANAAAFLCSELACNITGQALNIDGGQCMRN